MDSAIEAKRPRRFPPGLHLLGVFFVLPAICLAPLTGRIAWIYSFGILLVLYVGVVGYSSHQGLLRFREEAGTYEPDLVLVSFGWNDGLEIPFGLAVAPAIRYRLRALMVRCGHEIQHREPACLSENR